MVLERMLSVILPLVRLMESEILSLLYRMGASWPPDGGRDCSCALYLLGLEMLPCVIDCDSPLLSVGGVR